MISVVSRCDDLMLTDTEYPPAAAAEVKLAAITISGEAKPDDYSQLEVRYILLYVTCTRLILT